MDNIFVPNQTFSLSEAAKIIEGSSLPVDSHLMISDPDRDASLYAKAGSHSVTFHIEASTNPLDTISSIRAAGARVGLALKPGTPFAKVEELLDEIDMLLIMTVEPGFGGQKFMGDQIAKIQKARTWIDQHNLGVWLQVDGGISLETIILAAAAGADTFVAGNAIYQAASPTQAISALRAAALAATS